MNRIVNYVCNIKTQEVLKISGKDNVEYATKLFETCGKEIGIIEYTKGGANVSNWQYTTEEVYKRFNNKHNPIKTNFVVEVENADGSKTNQLRNIIIPQYNTDRHGRRNKEPKGYGYQKRFQTICKTIKTLSTFVKFEGKSGIATKSNQIVKEVREVDKIKCKTIVHKVITN